MATTTYSIDVRYQLQDKASKPAKKMGDQFQRTSNKASGLGRTIRRVAAIATAGLGFGLAKKVLIDYNSSMDAARIKMQTLIALGTDTAFVDNQKRAAAAIRQMTKDAAVGVGTTQDYVMFAGEITKPLLDAGASMNQLTNLTKLGVTAAKAFGIEGEVAGRDIQQMMIGQIKAVDRLPKLLGVSSEAWNKMFREEGPQRALKELEKVLDTKQMRAAAEAYGESWDGVTSTLQDNLQRTLGKVGLPLMKALSKEVVKANEFFTKNPERVEKFIKSFSSALITGFGHVKNVVGFIADHSDMLLTVAKAWIGLKIGKGILGAGRDIVGTGVGGVQTARGMAASLKDALKDPISGISIFRRGLKRGSVAATKAGKSFLALSKRAAKHTAFVIASTGAMGKLTAAMTSTIGKFGGVGIALAAFAFGLKKAAKFFDERQEKELATISRRPEGFLAAATEGKSNRAILAQARSAGLVEDGEVDLARLINAVKGKKGSLSKQILAEEQELFEKRGGTISLLQGVEGYGGDRRTVEAYKSLVAALAEERDLATSNLDQMINLQGGLINVAKTMFNFGLPAFDVTRPEDKFSMFPESAFDLPSKKMGRDTKKNGDVNITINTIKVVADDPDRFAIRMVGAFKDANTRPVSSRLTGSLNPGGRPA